MIGCCFVCSQLELSPFLRCEELDWALLNLGRNLRGTQTKFLCMKRFAYYLPGCVRHQFTDEFCIPLLPPEDMESQAMTRAAAQIATATAVGVQSRFTFCKVTWGQYLGWFERAGRPHLFPEELRESQ